MGYQEFAYERLKVLAQEHATAEGIAVLLVSRPKSGQEYGNSSPYFVEERNADAYERSNYSFRYLPEGECGESGLQDMANQQR